jgi:hypothetical protein
VRVTGGADGHPPNRRYRASAEGPSASSCAASWLGSTGGEDGPGCVPGARDAMAHGSAYGPRGASGVGCLLRCRLVLQHDLKQAADGIVHVQDAFRVPSGSCCRTRRRPGALPWSRSREGDTAAAAAISSIVTASNPRASNSHVRALRQATGSEPAVRPRVHRRRDDAHPSHSPCVPGRARARRLTNRAGLREG